jgi:cation:H+ antiporter
LAALETAAQNPLLAIAMFLLGAVIVVGATEAFLKGLVGVAAMVGLSTFAITTILSGMEAENTAVGLASGGSGFSELALGAVFGGAIFLVCVALGVGALLYPLRVRLPKPILVIFLATPVVSGLGVAWPVLLRPIGGVLLVLFAAAMMGLVVFSRGHRFFESEALEEFEREQPSRTRSVIFALFGLVAIAAGGELLATGARALVAGFPIPPLLMGMVIGPAVIELEEVIRQAVPTKEGRPDVAAGNLVGTLLYFLLFNLGLIAVATPVAVLPLVRTFDWPVSILVTALAVVLLWRGGVSRWQGLVLVVAYAAFVAGHVFLR